MARGWESKSVEDQINDRKAEAEKPGKTKPSLAEIEQKAKRESILLARSRTASVLESTRDERYRALLKRTLDHLDSELAKFGISVSGDDGDEGADSSTPTQTITRSQRV